jgi:hypothetical protein
MRVQLQTHEAGRAAVFHPDGVRLFLHAEAGSPPCSRCG